MQDDGYALPVVLIILALLFAISAALLTQGQNQFDESKDWLDYETALLISQNAFAETEAALNTDREYKGTGGVVQEENLGSYQIEVKRVSEWERYILVTSQKGGYKKQFEAKAEVDKETGKVTKLSWHLTK